MSTISIKVPKQPQNTCNNSGLKYKKAHKINEALLFIKNAKVRLRDVSVIFSDVRPL